MPTDFDLQLARLLDYVNFIYLALGRSQYLKYLCFVDAEAMVLKLFGSKACVFLSA